MTCPPPGCLQETCCPKDDFGYLSDELVVWQIADFGYPSGNPGSVAALIGSDPNADIVLAVGDCSYTGNYTNDVGAFYGVPWLSRVKMWPAPGNHDLDYGSELSTYLSFFSFLGSSRYYSRRFGILEIFMLSDGFKTDMTNVEPDGYLSGTINADGTLTGGSSQWRWFVRSVQASTAIWKIACFHHPPWASGNGHVGQPGVTANGSNVPLQWQFKELGIDLVLSGHEHSAELLQIDGVSYFVNGLGGKDITGFGTPITGSVSRYNGAFGALRIRLTPNSLLGEFKTVTALTPISFTLTK